MKTLYHATSEKNLVSILDKGILHKWEGVYLTDSAESAARWLGFRLAAIGESTVIVIEVKVDEKQLSEGCDHSPMMMQIFGVGESIVHDGDINPGQITNVIRYELNKGVN